MPTPNFHSATTPVSVSGAGLGSHAASLPTSVIVDGAGPLQHCFDFEEDVIFRWRSEYLSAPRLNDQPGGPVGPGAASFLSQITPLRIFG